MKTLGYHLQMATAVFRDNSAAVVFLKRKIAESPKGADEDVIADEGQMVYLLTQIHLKGPNADVEYILAHPGKYAVSGDGGLTYAMVEVVDGAVYQLKPDGTRDGKLGASGWRVNTTAYVVSDSGKTFVRVPYGG